MCNVKMLSITSLSQRRLFRIIWKPCKTFKSDRIVTRLGIPISKTFKMDWQILYNTPILYLKKRSKDRIIKWLKHKLSVGFNISITLLD